MSLIDFINKTVILWIFKYYNFYGQKQPPRGFPGKRCSENIQQIYRRTPMPRCNFNKLYWNHTSAWVFSCKFAAYFQNNNLFPRAPLEGCFCIWSIDVNCSNCYGNKFSSNSIDQWSWQDNRRNFLNRRNFFCNVKTQYWDLCFSSRNLILIAFIQFSQGFKKSD